MSKIDSQNARVEKAIQTSPLAELSCPPNPKSRINACCCCISTPTRLKSREHASADSASNTHHATSNSDNIWQHHTQPRHRPCQRNHRSGARHRLQQRYQFYLAMTAQHPKNARRTCRRRVQVCRVSIPAYSPTMPRTRDLLLPWR